MTDGLRVVFRKYDGSLHWQLTLRRLGEDEHGIWAGAPAGATARRGSEPPVTIGHDHVLLFPPQAGWVARFNAEPYHTEVYCDLTTAPVWPARDEVTMVDLDLDVCRMRRDRSVRLLDEDEFAVHRLRYGIPTTSSCTPQAPPPGCRPCWVTGPSRSPAGTAGGWRRCGEPQCTGGARGDL